MTLENPMRQGPLQLKLTIINVYERGGKCIRDDNFSYLACFSCS